MPHLGPEQNRSTRNLDRSYRMGWLCRQMNCSRHTWEGGAVRSQEQGPEEWGYLPLPQHLDEHWDSRPDRGWRCKVPHGQPWDQGHPLLGALWRAPGSWWQHQPHGSRSSRARRQRSGLSCSRGGASMRRGQPSWSTQGPACNHWPGEFRLQ